MHSSNGVNSKALVRRYDEILYRIQYTDEFIVHGITFCHQEDMSTERSGT